MPSAEAPAIYDDIGLLRRFAVAEPQAHAFLQDPVKDETQCGLRRKMCLLREEKCVCEAVAERGLERRKLGRRQAPVPCRHAGETVEFGTVASERQGNRAVDFRAWIGFAPERDTARPERVDQGRGVVLLAAKREHRTGIDAARIGEGFGRLLMQRDGMAAPCKHERLPKSGDARPTNGDLVAPARHQSPSATPSRRGSAPPSSPSGVTAMTCSPLVNGTRRTS